MTIEVHLFLPQMRMTMDAIVERAAAAESAGFAGIAFMDHMEAPAAPDQPMYEAVLTATWVGARTAHLKVGNLVLCDGFRHPALLAKQAVTLDHATGGRFELALGWGSVPDELAAYGFSERTPRARVERLAESLEVIRRIWTGERVTFDGAHHQLRDVQASPTPAHRIPIVIGGVGPRTLELVAEYADWWNVPTNRSSQIEVLRDRVGRARPSVQQFVTLVTDEATREDVISLSRRRFGGMAGQSGLVAGNPAELAAHLRQLEDRGVERLYAWFTDFARPETLTAFGEVLADTGAVRPSAAARPPALA